MGNEQSNQTEEAVFDGMKCIPILGNAYGAVRSVVYAGKGDKKRAVQSLTDGTLAFVPTGRMLGENIQHALLPEMRWVDRSDLLWRLRTGDLVEFNMGVYSHYAFYLENGTVMDITATNWKDTSTGICERDLKNVCPGALVRISNHDDAALKFFNREPRRRPTELTMAAWEYANTTQPYEYLFRNCEYYCTLWRFGKGFSTQAARFSATPSGAILKTLEDLTLLGPAGAAQREFQMMEKYNQL